MILGPPVEAAPPAPLAPPSRESVPFQASPVMLPTTPKPAVLPMEPVRPATGSLYYSLEDRNDSMLVGNPYLDGPRCKLGWFATAELDLLDPHVHSELKGTVTAGSITNLVSLPSARLDWAVGPRIELGYRFGEATGEVLASYRFLTTTGSATIAGFDGAGNLGSLHSRFAMNVIDLDYACQEPSLQPFCEMKWRMGVRLAGLFFDSEEVSPLLRQHDSNDFFGAGPHVALDLYHPLAHSRLGLFGKIDAAGVLGRARQEFDQTIPGPISGFMQQDGFIPSVMLNVQAGIGWTPTGNWRLVGRLYLRALVGCDCGRRFARRSMGPGRLLSGRVAVLNRDHF